MERNTIAFKGKTHPIKPLASFPELAAPSDRSKAASLSDLNLLNILITSKILSLNFSLKPNKSLTTYLSLLTSGPAQGPKPITPPPPARTILILGPRSKHLTSFHTHITNSPPQSLNLNNVLHSLAFFDGTPLYAYESSLRKDHLRCFTGAVILYSSLDVQSLDAAKGIVDELRGYEMECLMKGGIVLVANSKTDSEERELGRVEGADAHLECDVESEEGCKEVLGTLVGIIEGRWEEWALEREKRLAREEWEGRMRKREKGRLWRSVLCGRSDG